MKTKTRAVEFDYVPAIDSNYACVRPGMDPSHACSTADNLDEAVREILSKGASDENGLSAELAFLCSWAMDASRAYREAAGVAA